MEEWFDDDVVQLILDENLGRYLTARKSVSAEAVLEEYIDTEISEIKPIKCAGCEGIVYCSSECQRNDSKHDTPCVKNGKNILSEWKIRGMDNETTLDELKLAFRVKVTKETQSSVSATRWNEIDKKLTTYNEFAKLISNDSSYTEEENEFITNTFERLGIVKDLWNEMLTIHHQCLCNAFCINSSNGISKLPMGRAIYVKGAFFNHSCRPNVFFAQKPGTAIMQYITYGSATQDEPLNICYTAVATDYYTRQEILLDEYKFICKCVRCEEDKAELKSMEAERERERDEKDKESLSSLLLQTKV